jgi:hypothetical protein
MRFKLFRGQPDEIEREVNQWLASNDVSIKGTDLAAGEIRVSGTDTRSGKRTAITRSAPFVMVGLWYD